VPPPLPGEAVVARGVGGVHPVFRARDVEQVAADPGVVPPVDELDVGILDRIQFLTGKTGQRRRVGEPRRIVGFQQFDPPPLALRIGDRAAHAHHMRHRRGPTFTSAGRSIHRGPNRRPSSVATVVNVSPSDERATTV
jgi:hypothetical protein